MKISKNHLEIRVAVIIIPCVLIIFSIPFVAVNFGTIEHIKQNPKKVSFEYAKDIVNSHKPCKHEQSKDNSMSPVKLRPVMRRVIEGW